MYCPQALQCEMLLFKRPSQAVQIIACEAPTRARLRMHKMTMVGRNDGKREALRGSPPTMATRAD